MKVARIHDLEIIEARDGLWCDKCLNSTVVEATLSYRLDGGPIHLHTVQRCLEHEL